MTSEQLQKIEEAIARADHEADLVNCDGWTQGEQDAFATIYAAFEHARGLIVEVRRLLELFALLYPAVMQDYHGNVTDEQWSELRQAAAEYGIGDHWTDNLPGDEAPNT